MGVHCSKPRNQLASPTANSTSDGLLDPFMHQLEQRSIEYTTGESPGQLGQLHLLHKQQRTVRSFPGASSSYSTNNNKQLHHHPTRLIVRRRPVRTCEEGLSGTHIYAVRYPANQPLKREIVQHQQTSEQAPPRPLTRSEARPKPATAAVAPQSAMPPMNANVRLTTSTSAQQAQAKILAASSSMGSNKSEDKDKEKKDVPSQDHLFAKETMLATPISKVKDWVTVSDEHKIYIADVGLTPAQCDLLVQITESVCRGQYAAYTYAKQTLGCREFPALAQACQEAVHTVVHAIVDFSGNAKLLLDDREPHMVKYDDTKRERQKLDMHTDKSEWTFLISLSDGSGLDYDGGGTYFECLDATVHIQRGHALIFPGKLRHCGQRITRGLRFLLVGFLVDKGVLPTLPTLPTLPAGPIANTTAVAAGTARSSHGATNTGRKAFTATDGVMNKLYT